MFFQIASKSKLSSNVLSNGMCMEFISFVSIQNNLIL